MPQEIVAIIQTIQFSQRSKLNPDTYLDVIRRQGCWKSPTQFMSVAGKTFKLILYDPSRKALTAEVEIVSVDHTNVDLAFPWSNRFRPGSWTQFDPTIDVAVVRQIEGLEKLGEVRAPYRNVNAFQYEAIFAATIQADDLTTDAVSEGILTEQRYLRHARNRAIVERCKVRDDYTCQTCHFRLEVERRSVIDCHHLVPFTTTDDRITSIDELICLCPTCHRIAHARQPPFTPKEVRKLLSKEISD